MTNGISSSLSYSVGHIEWKQTVIHGLNTYAKTIDTNRYYGCIIINHNFGVDCQLKITSETKVIYKNIFQGQHQIMENCWFPYVRIPVTDIIWIDW